VGLCPNPDASADSCDAAAVGGADAKAPRYAYDSRFDGRPERNAHLKTQAHQEFNIHRVGAAGSRTEPDQIAVEDPLEIRLAHASLGEGAQTLAITMRTPGHDAELAAGYLYCEAVLRDPTQIVQIAACAGNANAIRVDLDGPAPRLESLKRVGTMNSSCGVCGKTSLAAVTASSQSRRVCGSQPIDASLLQQLPARLRAAQTLFAVTGGSHGVGLFDLAGRLLALREDVGRHNALDKLVGQAFLGSTLPWTDHVLLLSGRASFELLQKATMAGASIVAAVGAPSSLAIEQAQAAGITLVGFLGERGFNIYAGAERVRLA
jgi:FdhD protein